CTRSVPCSGVPQPPGEPRWRCEPRRTDGCPDAAPAQGAACKTPGKTCSYGSCGSLAYTCAADSRKWFVSGGTAPPPSMPGHSATPPVTTPQPTAPAWKACPAGGHFGCAPRSQGAAPPRGQEVPRVCGCIPTCPASRHVLISQDAGGTWPDGSRKGRFSCSSAGIPSARPRTSFP